MQWAPARRTELGNLLRPEWRPGEHPDGPLRIPRLSDTPVEIARLALPAVGPWPGLQRGETRERPDLEDGHIGRRLRGRPRWRQHMDVRGRSRGESLGRRDH